MNTNAADLDVIAERSSHVYGRRRQHGGAGDSGRGTARGVFHGIRASLRHAFGSDDLAGRRVLVQGVGSVGGELAGALAEAGAELILTDVAGERAAERRRAPRRTSRRRGDRARDRVRRLRAVRRRRHARPRVDPAAPLPDRRRLREQPARRARGRRAPSRGRDPLRARLRHQRRRCPAADGDWRTSAGTRRRSRSTSPAIGTTLGEIYASAEAEGLTTAEAAERLAAARLGAD